MGFFGICWSLLGFFRKMCMGYLPIDVKNGRVIARIIISLITKSKVIFQSFCPGESTERREGGVSSTLDKSIDNLGMLLYFGYAQR